MNTLNDIDQAVLAATLEGLPLTPAPYAEIARSLGITEADVLGALSRIEAAGVNKRFGIVVRHRELGYRANAMVVWDIADNEAAAVGARLSGLSFVTLCYRRTRRPPRWPFNLYCMIHGRDRETVREQIAVAREAAGIVDRPFRVLFSRRRFKQCAGRYVVAVRDAAAAA